MAPSCLLVIFNKFYQPQLRVKLFALTHLSQMHLSSSPKNVTKTYGCLMFSGGRERVHREQMC